MPECRIVCVGKLKESYWREAVAEYEKRISAFCRFNIIELSEERLPGSPSPAQIERALELEGAQILKKCAGRIYPLCIEGRETDSVTLSKMLEKDMEAPGTATFIIGSSFGLSDSVKQSGKGLSMSPMTFPHQLARVMLCEQIYRAFSIISGTKYHK